MKSVRISTIAAFAITAFTTPSLAQSLSLGFGDGIEYTSTHMFNDASNSYQIMSPDGGFSFDPDAGAWEKILLAPSNGFIPDEIYCVEEWVTFNPDPTGLPSPALEDWHETIFPGPDGQIWDIWNTELGDPTISIDPGGPPLPGLQWMINMEGTELWFDFDPIDIGPDGVTLHIQKYFRYTGATIGFDPVTIVQYPTPTPSSLALLGLAGIVATKRRR